MSDISSTTSSGLTGAGGGNMLRITGMATGLDIDAMVTKMMAAQQMKIDKANQNKQVITWKQDAYKDIINAIKDLQDTFLNSKSPDKYMLSSNNYSPFSALVTDPTAASVTASVGAKVGAYSISFTSDDTTHLADFAQLSSSSQVVTTKGLSATDSSKLSDLGLTGMRSFDLNYNGTTKSISINDSDTIQNVINNISTNTGGNVIADFSELTGKFSLRTSNTGSSTTISISNIKDGNSNDSDLAFLKLTDVVEQKGKDAIINITAPGVTDPVTVTRSTNDFTIDGINYSLTSKKDTTFSITQDVDKTYGKIKDFIDKYNDLIGKVQTKLTEKKDYNYKPLTAAQKKGMSSDDIKTWEDKAKQGILRNDDKLQILMSDLRSAFTTSVKDVSLAIGKYGSNSIGIDTSNEYKDNGKILIVDADKLKNAISQYGDQIVQIFTKPFVPDATYNSETDVYKKSQYKFENQGILQRINDTFIKNVGFTGILGESAILTQYANKQDDFSAFGISGLNTLPDQIFRQELFITKLNNDFKTKQEAYYQKFSRLETAMNKLNSQQSWLSQQFS